MRPSPQDIQFISLAIKCLKKAEYPNIDGEEVISIAQCMGHLAQMKKAMEDELMGPKEVKDSIVKDKVVKPSGTNGKRK